MINTYSSQPDPCGSCSKETTEMSSEIKEDYIQINLDGNDTTLFIRETSVEDMPMVQEETANRTKEEAVEVVDDVYLSGPYSEEPLQTSTKTEKPVEDVKQDDNAARNKQFDQLYFKKWSGKTYFEEELRKIRVQEYQKDLEESIKRRNLWKAFQKDIARERRRDLIRTSGPEWWQEPSRKQICLAISLCDVIIADYEEGVTGRTRQWLLDLGVTTRVTPKQVRACMKRSLLDPIDFLLEIHSVILKSQLTIKKKRGDLERPFSVNERLLLTAVCVLHLPTLLIILHYLLPPPKPYSTKKHIQELLFGDLDDERVRYSTPYMEPIPFRSQSHFINWAVDEVFRALLPSIITTGILEEFQSNSLEATIPSMKMSVMSQHRPSSVADKKLETSRLSEYSNTGDSVTWLIAQCIAKREVTASLFPFREADHSAPTFYSRQLTKRSIVKDSIQPVSEETDDDFREEVSVSPSVNTATSGHRISTGTLRRNTASLNETQSFTDAKPQIKKDSQNYSGEPLKFRQMEFIDDLLPKGSHNSQLSKHSQETGSFEVKNTSSIFNSKIKDELSEKGGSKSEVDQEPSELQQLWKEISGLPKNQQLKHALGVLRAMGDPLARLPKVHTIPTVLRWLELRQGKNRVLSNSAKEELLRRSRGMWKMAPIGNSTEGPKVKCSKLVERQLTWNKKQWLGVEVNKAVGKYYSTVKQEKVDNARTFFPTMLNHYDHGSKLNRDFRDVFFTYLPPREADTYVYRPWQPQETNTA